MANGPMSAAGGVSSPGAARAAGAALRELRRNRGLSLRDVAPHLALSFAELSRVERGEKPLLIPLAEAAERFFASELRDRGAVGSLVAAATAPRITRSRTPPDRLAPSLVLPPPTSMVGRDQEKAQLEAALAHGPVTVVHGLPGVGKSALVAQTLREVAADRYRDGVLVADTSTYDAGTCVTDLGRHIIGDWLARLEARPAASPTPDTRALTHALGDRQMLMVLENVDDIDQVKPFLPALASGSRLVVTSRRRLPELALRGGASTVLVRPLPVDGAVRLLRAGELGDRVDLASDHSLENLAGWCGGLPAALLVALDHLRHVQDLTVDALSEALAIDAQRLTVLSDIADPCLALRPLLTDAYAGLTARGRWLFRMLGLHPGPHVTVDGAATLAGQPPDTVQHGLHELTDAHLLDPIQPGRWHWHDLPRLLAVELVRAHENPYQHIHAVRRWLQRMTRVAGAVAARDSDSAGRSAAGAALDADAVNLPAMTATAARYGQAGLARQLTSVLDHAGRSDLAERCHTSTPEQRPSGAAWVVSRATAPPRPPTQHRPPLAPTTGDDRDHRSEPHRRLGPAESGLVHPAR